MGRVGRPLRRHLALVWWCAMSDNYKDWHSITEWGRDRRAAEANEECLLHERQRKAREKLRKEDRDAKDEQGTTDRA